MSIYDQDGPPGHDLSTGDVTVRFATIIDEEFGTPLLNDVTEDLARSRRSFLDRPNFNNWCGLKLAGKHYTERTSEVAYNTATFTDGTAQSLINLMDDLSSERFDLTMAALNRGRVVAKMLRQLSVRLLPNLARRTPEEMLDDASYLALSGFEKGLNEGVVSPSDRDTTLSGFQIQASVDLFTKFVGRAILAEEAVINICGVPRVLRRELEQAIGDRLPDVYDTIYQDE
jgi:hypothetical protein